MQLATRPAQRTFALTHAPSVAGCAMAKINRIPIDHDATNHCQPRNANAARFGSTHAIPGPVLESLNTAYDALSAIRAITTVLTASHAEATPGDEGAHLTTHLAAGLLAGLQVIADLAGDDLCRLADRLDDLGD
ncbi:hypothetical protein ABW99_15815 [Pandoraea thiooxydans]|uniref:Uncharacterized protein n=2 Tax=Pandoraea thiooxydans TaxID=445709 RepID=A0A0G3ETX9_9BURK|nr:hypothetical protein ABW99_15815 [Pandoraea thiooxydans]